MPHQRTRHLTRLMMKTLKFSPIVGILGHRQVGKTTLSQRLGNQYFSFDQTQTLTRARENPEAFLDAISKFPAVLDECQLAPELFPAMKDRVRTHPSPGQLILTGSVRFTSRKMIRESLTGRIVNWELLPMDLSEIDARSLPNALIKMLEKPDLEFDLPTLKNVKQSDIDQYLSRGGLPGVFAIRDFAVRAQRFETQIETLLERDLRLLVQTSLDLRSLRRLLLSLARMQGKPLEVSEVSRETRISRAAIRRFISAFQSMFIIRLIATAGNQKKPILYFEDQGERSHLYSDESAYSRLSAFIYANIRHQWHYRPELGIELFEFRNRGGAHVPFVLKSPKGHLGIIPILDENPTRAEISSAGRLITEFPRAKCVLAHLGSADRTLGKDLRIIPLSKLV